MSKDNTNVSREGYLTNLRKRLEADLDKIIDGTGSRDEFIQFAVDEIYASYKRGQKAGPQRKKAYNKRKPQQS